MGFEIVNRFSFFQRSQIFCGGGFFMGFPDVSYPKIHAMMVKTKQVLSAS